MACVQKRALVTGGTGQVGSFLCEYLLEKNYHVTVLDRRKSVSNYQNIEKIKNRIDIVEGDITDSCSIGEIIKNGNFREIYNLAAQSHVHTSFEQPKLTFEVDAAGVLNILEAIRYHASHVKMYQASTSELFGKSPPPQNENTAFIPQSPYAVAKLAAHHMVRLYAESYNLKCASGIMFNCESSRRGDNFLPKKVTNWVKKYHAGEKVEPLQLGNMGAKRDWSNVRDAVDAIYRICNQDEFRSGQPSSAPFKTYTFGSGVSVTVRNFLMEALSLKFNVLFTDKFEFLNYGKRDEKIVDKTTGKVIVECVEKFYRPAEVDYLMCDYSNIKRDLGWSPKYTLNDTIKEMLEL